MNRFTKVATLTSLLVAGAFGAASTASANTGIIKFSGAISAATCDMNVSVNGIVSPTGVVDLGVHKASDVTAVGTFGTAVNLALTPDEATCDISPAGEDALVQISAAQTDATNTSVVTSAETTTTNAGVLFQLASGGNVVNNGSVSLTSGSADLDAAGAIHFTAQPYAIAASVNPGIIGGSVSYTVAYL